MWMCQECGKKFKTVRAAEKAAYDGCPGCGSVDVDVAPLEREKKHRELTREEQHLINKVVSGVSIEMRKF